MNLLAALPALALAASLAVGHSGPPAVKLQPAPGKVFQPRAASHLAKYEPRRGAYLGVALDFSSLPGSGSKVGPMADAMGAWESETWRRQALFMQFVQFPHEDGTFPKWDADPWGWIPPQEFCTATDALKASPLITLEPMKPELFRDWHAGTPAYDATEAFARAAGQWGKPMFIRFAHEMNGSWYPWAEWIDKNRNMKRDPGEETGFTAFDYRLAFRRVAQLFRQYAPNVAMVWCPNSGLLGGDRRDVFSPFYPGDDVVDWVGLDIYERGWTMPEPGAHLWSGQFAQNLTYDAADDPDTKANESVNFYQTYAVKKNKPLMICETSATLSYRNDLSPADRELLNFQWKAGYWNANEYGWLQSVYGTTAFREQKLSEPIDVKFPRIKAILWFQIAKREYTIPVEKTDGGKKEIVWFDNQWTDYRIGGGVEQNKSSKFSTRELDLFRKLTSNNYFLSEVN
jgi:hypothetical protein